MVYLWRLVQHESTVICERWYMWQCISLISSSAPHELPGVMNYSEYFTYHITITINDNIYMIPEVILMHKNCIQWVWWQPHLCLPLFWNNALCWAITSNKNSCNHSRCHCFTEVMERVFYLSSTFFTGNLFFRICFDDNDVFFCYT